MKKTLILGASTDRSRYAYKATVALQKNNLEAVPVGINPGEINGTPIVTDKKKIEGVDTVTMYVGPRNQPSWYDYILSLNPKRVIFNPGAENPEFEKMLINKGIKVEEACTLVLLSTGQY